MLTDDHLKTIMPQMPAERRTRFLPAINQTLQVYSINTPRRAAAFLGQVAHESGQFRYMEELWGPTAQQKRYEPPTDLARQLGNVQPGDGSRYRGRGPIQITGRANYQRYGKLLQLDLVAQPDLAATPAVGLSIAGLYWSSLGLNALAEKLDDREITRRINGGFNGLAERVALSERARAVLCLADFSVAPRSRGATRTESLEGYARPVRIPRLPLPRGHVGESSQGQGAALEAPAL